MQLSDFFDPLNLQNLFLFVLVMFAFDVIGFYLAHLLRLPAILRAGFWLIGLGFFVFLWFLLHYFLPFHPLYVTVTLGILTLGGLPLYLKEKAIWLLIKECLAFPWVFILLLPLAKALFFLDSFPPYLWDEMAYHYYSPAQLLAEQRWDYVDPMNSDSLYLFAMTPRFLDTSFVLMFALTKTYAMARLLHTVVFLTSVFIMGRVLKRFLGFWPALIFILGALWLNLTILIGATTGYTDSGTASLLILFLASCIGWLFERKRSFLFAMTIYGALAMGGKYTSLSFILAGGICLFLLEILQRREITLRGSGRFLISLSALSLVFGGYWYIKNFVISGNPIYPFLFSCWPGVLHCGAGNGFFEAWTLALKPANYQPIIESIFQTYSLYTIASFGLGIALVSGLILRKLPLFILSLFLPMTILVEVLLSFKVVGFELRYFSHWLFFVPLFFALPFQILPELRKNSLPRWMKMMLAANFLLFAAFFTQHAQPIITENIKNMNILKQITDNDRWFAHGRLSFDQWVDPMMPHMHPFISWCGEKRDKPIQIYSADPKLLYWTEGLMKVYLVNCDLHYIKDIWNNPPEMMVQKVDEFLATHPNVLVVSALTCEESKKAGVFPNPYMNKYIVVNKELVCRGTEVAPRVYAFPTYSLGASP